LLRGVLEDAVAASRDEGAGVGGVAVARAVERPFVALFGAGDDPVAARGFSRRDDVCEVAQG
jgi:hypothetical protein